MKKHVLFETAGV